MFHRKGRKETALPTIKHHAVGPNMNTKLRVLPSLKREEVKGPMSRMSLGVLLLVVTWFAASLLNQQGAAYTFTQCVYKSIMSIDDYSKSGRFFPNVSSVLIEGEAGPLSRDFPTDKLKNHPSYLAIYDMILKPYQNASAVLEVGVKKGGSLKLWREFFSFQTHIYGIDIDPGVPTFPRDAHIKVLVVDTSERNLDSIRNVLGK